MREGEHVAKAQRQQTASKTAFIDCLATKINLIRNLLCCLGKREMFLMGIFNFRSTFFLFLRTEEKKFFQRKDAKSLVLYLTTQQLEASNLKII